MTTTAHTSPSGPSPQRAVGERGRNRDGSEDDDAKLLLTVVEAARRLGIGRTFMYELLASGQVDSVHVGRLHRVPVDALTDFVDRSRRAG